MMPKDCFSALGRQVAMRIQPFQPRAVVEVEARHRVALRRGRQVQQVGRAQRQQRGQRFLVQLVVRGGALQRGRARRRTAAQQMLACGLEVGRAVRRRFGSAVEIAAGPQPAAKPGIGDSVQKVLSCGSSRLQLFGHALDQEVAERHVAQARLAVADRVERGDA